MAHVLVKPCLLLSVLHDSNCNASVRFGLTNKRFLRGDNCCQALTVPIEIDGQSLNLWVDTGAPQTFVISNNTIYNGGACDGCIYGLYECRQLGCDKETERIAFLDGTVTHIVYHKGDLKVGDHMVLGIDFGIVKNYTALGFAPHSSLGLGLADASRDFVPILDQLFTKRVIKNKEFSIYFYPENRNDGELLLGGGDPDKYLGKLVSVPLTSKYEWAVKLDNIKVAGTSILEAPCPIVFDTGTSFFIAPMDVVDAIIGHIEKSARNAGHEIVWHWIHGLPYLQDCSDREYLPSIELILEGVSDADNVALAIPPELYSTRMPNSKTCLLSFLSNPGDIEEITVGVTLLRDYYLNFNEDERQIGIARTVKRSQGNRGLRRASNNRRSPPSLSLHSHDTLSEQYF